MNDTRKDLDRTATRLLSERKLSSWESGLCYALSSRATNEMLLQVLSRLCIKYDLKPEYEHDREKEPTDTDKR